MLSYLTKRILAALATLLAVVFFTFVVFFALAPDPATMVCGQTCTPERIDLIRQQLGVDQPFFVQLFTFLAGIFVGREYGEGASAIPCAAPCIGRSFQTNQDVLTMILDRLPVSVTLAVGAAILWSMIGISLGLVSALKPGSLRDKGAMTLSLIGVAMPNYFFALVLQYVLVVQLQVLPFPVLGRFEDNPLQWISAFIMPWIVLSFIFVGVYARLTRTNVIDTLGENFVRTARAKGVSRPALLVRHALRPALTPLVTLFGIDVAALFGGALITETVFGLNGVGKLAFDAISTNDQPVIMGVTLFAAFFVVTANILVDLLYRALDPRVRLVTA